MVELWLEGLSHVLMGSGGQVFVGVGGRETQHILLC